MAEVPALPFDILSPPAPAPLPADYTWLIAGGAVFAVVLLAITARHLWRTRHRRRARRALRRTEAAYRAGRLSEREAAFAIARALMSGFETRHLHASADSAADWADFVARLDALRYTATDGAGVTPLFAQAWRWLRRRGQPC